jgi:quercetin 2,3-dioxygenase
MIEQHPSKIHKADFRASVATNSYWRFASLFGETSEKNDGNALKNIKKFDEITIQANSTFNYQSYKNQQILVIPIVGAVDFFSDYENGFVHINQIQFLKNKKGKEIVFKNPYENELVSFILVEIEGYESNALLEFDLKEANQLVTLFDAKEIKMSISIFDARVEGTYKLKPNHGVFAFVISGAFEFQNRLLEDRDALSIWAIDEIEFESLTQNSLLLIIETEINSN